MFPEPESWANIVHDCKLTDAQANKLQITLQEALDDIDLYHSKLRNRPDTMVAALMREVERMANGPLPQAARHKRIAALEREISELAYIEEALVAAAIADGEDVQRSPGAQPHAVLGVRVVEARRLTRAA